VPKDKREIETGLLTRGCAERISPRTYFVYVSWKARSPWQDPYQHGRRFDIDDCLITQMARHCGINRQAVSA
jgi:hypothetical protein